MSTSKKPAPPPERFLVFLRHGIAEEATPEKNDEDRGLTREGHTRTKEIARGLAELLPKVEAIYTSPLLRAVQTALWVSKAYRSRAQVLTVDALAPAAAKRQFRALLKTITATRAVIVGHEPSLSAGVSALVGIDVPELKKGGCYGVRLLADGTAELEWLLPPRVLRRLAG
jgi:phosphohistidine phosphatase